MTPFVLNKENTFLAALKRFPLLVLFLTALAILSVTPKLWDDEYIRETITFIALSMISTTAIRLFIEGRGLNELWPALGIPFAAAIAWLMPDYQLPTLYVLAASGLCLSVAPFIGLLKTNDDFWRFKYELAAGFFTSALYAFLLAAGVTAIWFLLAQTFGLYKRSYFSLFGVDKIWLASWLLFFPAVFATRIPVQANVNSATPPSASFSFIVNRLVLPLMVLLIAAYFLYAVKSVFTGELGTAMTAKISLSVCTVGILVRFLSFPAQRAGDRLAVFYYQHFYKMILLPLACGVYALASTISRYGVTDTRYTGGLLFVWVAALAAQNLAAPAQARLYNAPALLAAFFLFCAYGPHSVVELPARSQAARLTTMLEKVGVVSPDGKIQPVPQEASFEDQKKISSIVEYLSSQGDYERIGHLVTPIRDVLPKAESRATRCRRSLFRWDCYRNYNVMQDIMEAWGMQYINAYERQLRPKPGKSQTIRVPQNDLGSFAKVITFAPFTYGTTFSLYSAIHSKPEERKYGEAKQILLELAPEGMMATLNDGRIARFAVGEAFQKLQANNKQSENMRARNQRHVTDDEVAVTVISGTGDFPAELRLTSLSGEEKDGEIKITNISGVLLFSDTQ